MNLGFLVCRKACVSFGARISPRVEPKHAANREEVYRGLGRNDPSPSTVLVPMAVPNVLAALNLARQITTAVMEPASIKWSFRRPSSPERPRQRCGSPPCSERAPASQAPQSQHRVWKSFMVYVR